MSTRAKCVEPGLPVGMSPFGNLPTPLEARLGKLVQMPKRGRSARPAAQQPAEVILFTGVRYERNGMPAAGISPLPTKPAGATPGKRRRG
jgi:hypothetical protein